MNCIQTINNKFDSQKRGKNTSKREKIEMAKSIDHDSSLSLSFNYLIDSIFSYRLFEVDWQYLRLNLTKLGEESFFIEYYEKVELRIFKRLINIFSFDKTTKLLKSHTESAIKFHLCKLLIAKLDENKVSTVEKRDNIESMTQSLSEIWDF